MAKLLVRSTVPQRLIKLRLEPDVLLFFQSLGAGYQRRMNAVLRSYMQQKRKKRA